MNNYKPPIDNAIGCNEGFYIAYFKTIKRIVTNRYFYIISLFYFLLILSVVIALNTFIEWCVLTEFGKYDTERYESSIEFILSDNIVNFYFEYFAIFLIWIPLFIISFQYFNVLNRFQSNKFKFKYFLSFKFNFARVILCSCLMVLLAIGSDELAYEISRFFRKYILAELKLNLPSNYIESILIAVAFIYCFVLCVFGFKKAFKYVFVVIFKSPLLILTSILSFVLMLYIETMLWDMVDFLISNNPVSSLNQNSMLSLGEEYVIYLIISFILFGLTSVAFLSAINVLKLKVSDS
ncbi:MAG: hypothetical protein HRU38_05245 [Saccharospirillaceae bacterium]|nr:hypothetical protein [Pseudomonadales bacterium]NRB78063.1 hypothetical protein [Saccharospirillaceae bacterium]